MSEVRQGRSAQEANFFARHSGMVRRTRPGISRFSGAQLRTVVRASHAPERRRKKENNMRPALAALVLTLAAISPASAQSADTVLFGGKVLTVDRDFSVREAIAI